MSNCQIRIDLNKQKNAKGGSGVANLKTLRESEVWKRMPLEERGKLADFLTRFVSPDYADDEAQAALKKELTENTSDKKNTNDNTK